MSVSPDCRWLMVDGRLPIVVAHLSLDFSNCFCFVFLPQLPPVEPFKMDSLSLQLTEGPQGYKITLKNMEAFGASNYKVESLKLGANGGEPFKARIIMPKLKIEAKYTSSGVLLIIPASGGGDFHAVFEGVTADLTGKTSARGAFLHVDSLSLVLDVKKVNMSISRAFNNNRILCKY